MVAHSGETTGRRLFGPLFVLLALVLLAYGLRLHNLDAFSFWTDEGLTPERSGYPIAQILRNEIVIQGYVTKDTHPPLYYLMLHGSRGLFGESDFAFRYPSVLFGVLFVPLIYRLARRMAPDRRGATILGLLVALLAAVNPLQIYYSQEARMYTLLVFLVTAASYWLWRALAHPALTPPLLRRYVFLYGLFAGLAFYTHYTVAFLILAQGLFWVWILWHGGLKRFILGAAALAVLAAIPLVPYTIPRLLSGAEANYALVSPLTMLQDVVHFFNLGLTTDFDQWVVKALDGVALAVLLVGVWSARPWFKRGFLLVWLLAVVFGLMAGSYLFKPMYQGVRHIMVGSPAFLLLLGFGLWAIWTWRPARRPSDGRGLAWSRGNLLALIPLALLLTGAAVSLANLYTNPAYVKDDFRAIINHIEQAAGQRDVVVYNNAVLLPLHDHYQTRPDIAVTALPVYPQFATGSEPELAALARDYDRIWYITDPPADRRDESKLIQGWFDDNLVNIDNRLFPARTTEARVITYGTSDPLPELLPDNAQPLDLSWTGWPTLAGYAISSPQPVKLSPLWFDLFWRGDQPAENGLLRFSLVGGNGREYAVAEQRLLGRERTIWNPDGLNRRSYYVELPVGLPPGPYALQVAPPGAAAASLGEVVIGSTAATGHTRSALAWDNGIALQTIDLWDETVLPGNNLPLTLYWRTGPDGVDLSNLRYRLEVIASDGKPWRSQEDRPGAPWLGRVEPDTLLQEMTGLYFRPETPPGRYRLRWTLLDGEAAVGAPAVEGQVTVEAWPLVRELPAAGTVTEAEFGPAIRLHGFDGGEAEGAEVPLTLYWQAAAAPPADYAVFVHLVNADTDEIIAQADGIPANGLRLTSGWRAGEVIIDPRRLALPADLPTGHYHIYTGMYNPVDGTRLPVTFRGENQPGDRLLLATLELTENR